MRVRFYFVEEVVVHRGGPHATERSLAMMAQTHAASRSAFSSAPSPSAKHCMRGTVPEPRATPWTFRRPVASAISPSVAA